MQKIDDDLLSEFKGIVNYGVIGLIQLVLQDDETEDLDVEIVTRLYDKNVVVAKQLMQDKNNDYGEEGRDMSQESFADLILAKVLLIKQILKNKTQKQ